MVLSIFILYRTYKSECLNIFVVLFSSLSDWLWPRSLGLGVANLSESCVYALTGRAAEKAAIEASRCFWGLMPENNQKSSVVHLLSIKTVFFFLHTSSSLGKDKYRMIHYQEADTCLLHLYLSVKFWYRELCCTFWWTAGIVFSSMC